MLLFRWFGRSTYSEISVLDNRKYLIASLRKLSDDVRGSTQNDEEEFTVFRIRPTKARREASIKVTKKVPPPRTNMMPIDQDWTNVWPGPRSFHPASVPLPVRQGYLEKGPPPKKYANAELMKIPNFLHLTPPAIKKQCEALKRFCTKWPEELDTEEAMDKHFPVQIIASDYCHSSPSIRDPMARIVTLKVKLSCLQLDEHARDKFLRLVGERYNPETDVVTITTDSCPLKKQNYEYAQYLLTAAYHESWKTEDWENEKAIVDMEKYVWTMQPSRENVEHYFAYNKKQLPDTKEYAEAMERLFNEGESDETLAKLKEAALNLLGFPPLNQTTLSSQ